MSKIKSTCQALPPFLIISSLLALTSVGFSAEVDNYTTSNLKYEDSTELLNRKFNDALEAAASTWNSDEFQRSGRALNVKTFPLLFWEKLDGVMMFNPMIKWLEEQNRLQRVSPKVDIYRSCPCWTNIAMKLRSTEGVFFINEVPIGIDKIGHFVDAGIKMYKRDQIAGKGMESAIRWSRSSENIFLGLVVSGVFSNGDLVANYEGYLLYRNLIEANSESGLPARVTFDNGIAKIQHAIDLRNHVNSYWNEAMNPSYNGKALQKHLVRILPSRCGQYLKHPEWYLPVNENSLIEKYKHIGIRPNPSLRMDTICGLNPMNDPSVGKSKLGAPSSSFGLSSN